MVNLFEDEFRTYHGPNHDIVRSTRGAMLGGPRSHATVIDTREMRHHLTVNFRLGGAWPFFRMPLAEASEQLVGLEHLWGRDGATLRERVHNAVRLMKQIACRGTPPQPLPKRRDFHAFQSRESHAAKNRCARKYSAIEWVPQCRNNRLIWW